MKTNKVLEIKNITKTYKIYDKNIDRLKEIFFKKQMHRVFIANDDVSFDLYEGETLGIIGVNGAGKSTILKIIAGVIEPTLGKIISKGRITALLELGTGFNEELSGYENIFLNGTLIGMSYEECEQRLQEIIDFSELGQYIHEPIKVYSSGMRMRLAFSIAIFSEPKILIVDEALSVGDAHFAAKCTQTLKERKKKNMSIIYVSHDLNSLKILSDRILLLNQGKIVDIGEPQKIMNTYNYLIAALNDSDGKKTFLQEEAKAFGTFEVMIESASLVSLKTASSKIVSGEVAKLTLKIKSKQNMRDVNVGILLKDRFGQDVFGITSYNLGKTFDFKEEQRCDITMVFPMNIGVGEYTLSAALAIGENHLDKCLHWIDYAASFEVTHDINEQFIGICKLSPIDITMDYND